MTRTNAAKVKDLSNWQPPTRHRRRPDGTVVVEKCNPGMSRKMVDLDGNVLHVSLANGVANRDPRDEYGLRIVAEKTFGNPRNRRGTPGGFLPFNRCPLGIEGLSECLPRSVRGRAPCRTSASGEPISDESPCACVVETIAHRQKANAAKVAAEERRVEPDIRKDQRAQSEQTTAVLEALTRVASMLADAGSKKRG